MVGSGEKGRGVRDVEIPDQSTVEEGSNCAEEERRNSEIATVRGWSNVDCV